MISVRRMTALALLLLLCAGCGDKDAPVAAPQAQPPAQLRKVTFNMSWLPQGSMAGVIAAIDQGFYREVGLEVDPIRGFGGIRTVNELDQGLFEFGYGDPLSVILNRSNGGHTRMIGALNDRWPAGLCFVRERHDLKTPQDLQGLTVGGGQSSPMQVILPVWLRNNGVNADGVTLMQLDPSVIAASVIEGKIDAGECWRGNSRPVYQKRAAEAGVTLGWIEYGDFGLDIYGSGLVTRDALIESDPQLVANFVAATYRGYAWTVQNQEQATDIMLARFPVLDRVITQQQIAESADLLRGPGKPGWMEPAKLQNTIAFLSAAYGVEKTLVADDIYTMRFISAP